MNRVVVGVDGSEPSARALEWAAEEAKLRGWTLKLVHAWLLPQIVATPGFGPVAPPTFAAEEFEEHGGAVAEAAAREARGRWPELEVEHEAVQASAAEALVAAADAGDLLVVGSRGRGGFAGLVLGSVSQQCAHHARCPVVIVPGGDAAGD